MIIHVFGYVTLNCHSCIRITILTWMLYVIMSALEKQYMRKIKVCNFLKFELAYSSFFYVFRYDSKNKNNAKSLCLSIIKVV